MSEGGLQRSLVSDKVFALYETLEINIMIQFCSTSVEFVGNEILVINWHLLEFYQDLRGRSPKRGRQ